MKATKLLVLCLAILTGDVVVLGQAAPDLENGFKAYGSYDGSNLDSINVENGNLMLHIPLPSTYPQRGGKLNPKSLQIVSSKQWQVQCFVPPGSGENCYWTPGTGLGALVATIGSGVGFDDTMDLSVHRSTQTVALQGGATTYSSWVDYVNTADGSQHFMAATPTSALDPNGNPLTSESVDTTGLRLDLSNPDPTTGIPSTGVLTDRHGNRYQLNKWAGTCSTSTDGQTNTITCALASHTASMTDVNGNVLTLNQGVSLGPTIDTMGRSFTAGYFSSGTQTSDPTGCVLSGQSFDAAIIYVYPGPGGASQQIKACYANIPISTAFGQGTVKEAQNASQPLTSMAEIATVIMPDNSLWVFQYDSYGNVTSIGLPNGGSISYSWEKVSIAPCTNTQFSRAVSSRTINDNNGHSFTWNYQWGTLANGTLTNTATDALNNDTVHTFTALSGGCPSLYETTTQEYQGTGSSRTLLKQTVTQYSHASSLNGITTPNYTGGAANVVPTTIQTTVYPSGRTDLVTKSYDTGLGANAPIFGNVVTEKDYDWGQNTLLRETDTTYQWQVDSRYLTANLLDLPASVVLKDGSGCALSETDYTYDENSNYLTSYENTVGSLPTGTHVAAPDAVSGNLTTVTRWLAPTSSCNPKGGTAVVTHVNWYNTGEAHLQIDALGNTTTHSYDPAYAGAYGTETCSPQTGSVAHCISGTYDFTTGRLTSLTNENATAQASGNTPGDSAHTTVYAYDLLARLTSAISPPDPNNSGSQAKTAFSYPVPISLPFTVTQTRSITPTLTDSVTSTYDGLGRVYKTQHALPPTGTAEIDTQYDGLDHVINVTNPHFSTSDPTYGKIQMQYDALGRMTQVTQQDGSIKSVAYNIAAIPGVLGDCTVSTDEAGHERKNCNDGLGRLVEVDEPNPGAAASYASGWVAVSGSEQQANTSPATSGSGPVSISGTEQTACARFVGGRCTITAYDSGTVYVTVNGHQTSQSYGKGDNDSTVASNLANAINNDSGAFVNASPPSGSTITLTARTTGASTNYSFTTSSATNDTTCIYFCGPSFTASPASGALTNGKNAAVTPDTGTVTATIGGTNYTVSYGANDTPSTIATNLASAISSGSLANASASGSTVTINGKSTGPAYDDSFSVGYTWNSSQFPNPSFTASTSGSSLTGGYNTGDPANRPFVTDYAYNGLGDLTTVTQKGDPTVNNSSQWRVRSFTYDTLGRLLTAQNPESGTITYVYDANGNLLQRTSPAPNQTGSSTQTISYCYDQLNRVTGRAYSAQTCPLSSPVVTYAYDSATNAIGHLISLTDQAGSASYSYDVLQRMAAETRTIAGITKNMSYTYNLDSSLKTLTNPSGAVITYTPDSAGRDVSAVDSGNGISYATAASYGADSSLTGFLSGNTITNSFTYNPRLQPVNMSAVSPTATVFSLSYNFNLGAGDNGNVLEITNNKDTTRNQTFTYDTLNRLTTAQNAGTNCAAPTVNGKNEYWGNSYGYDAWGNLMQKTPTKCNPENMSRTADAQNRLHVTTGADYQYDAAGNMTYDAVGQYYSYDSENRITGSNGYTYTYDGDGNRVKKSNGSTGTLYWYMSPGIVAESDLSGNLQSEYVFFDGQRVARKDFPGLAVSYYFSDHLKTTDVVTDAQGNIKNESDFYPWGGELQLLANDSNHYKFTGKERDTETGLDYFGARYYSNGLGRFITPDWAAKATAVPYAEFADPQSLNLYSYVRNVPTTRFDPDGHNYVFAPFQDWGMDYYLGQGGGKENTPSGGGTGCNGRPCVLAPPAPPKQPSGGLIANPPCEMDCAKPIVQAFIDAIYEFIGFKQVDPSTVAPPQDTDTINLPSSMKIPVPALITLGHIDDTGKPPANTQGGGKFDNDGRGGGQMLPPTDSHGNAITYREWDVNPLSNGQRDNQRIVTGSDGSAYYSGDHYTTFEQIRPENHQP
jgi:RHS repeat-associated protein